MNMAALGRQRQENPQFEANLGNVVIPCLKTVKTPITQSSNYARSLTSSHQEHRAGGGGQEAAEGTSKAPPEGKAGYGR